MTFSRLLAMLTVLLGTLLAPAYAQTADAELAQLVDALAPGSFKDREAAIAALVATGDTRVVPLLQTLAEGDLYASGADGKVVFISGSGATLGLVDRSPRPSWARRPRLTWKRSRSTIACAASSAPPSAS